MSTGNTSSTTPEAEIQEQLRKGSEVRLLGKMIGLKSLKRNLESEDELAADHVRENESKLFDKPMPKKRQRDDEMDIMATGDVYVNEKGSGDKKSVPRWLAATIALGSAGLGIAAAGLILDSTPEPPPAAVQPIHGYRLEIE